MKGRGPARTARAAALGSMTTDMGKDQTAARRKLTLNLDADLERMLMAERAKIGQETGLNVSLNAVAARAMRDGFLRRASN